MPNHEERLLDAWTNFFADVSSAGEAIINDPDILSESEKVEGLRHILRKLYLSIGSDLEASDVEYPELAWVHPFKSGQDNPDGLYQFAKIDLRYTYRLSGNIGTVRYLGLTIMNLDFSDGIEQLLTLNSEDLPTNEAGDFELYLSSEEPPAGTDAENWVTLPAKESNLMIRQFFSDWDNEEAAKLRLNCDDPSQPAGRLQVDDLIESLSEISKKAIDMVWFWRDFGQAHVKKGEINSFAHIKKNQEALLTMGASPEQAYGQCWWTLGKGEALIYEVEIPDCVYWGVQLGDQWYQSLDWVNHQSSLNGSQAAIDPDGIFRAVISAADPGVSNWIDTTGVSEGIITYRWNQSKGAPVPTLTLVKEEDIQHVLPEFTTFTTPEQRRQQLQDRRDGALSRFLR